MARPEEVFVVESECNEVVREFMKDTDAINLPKNIRETLAYHLFVCFLELIIFIFLVYLTHLDYVDTESIMTKKISKSS